MREQLDQFKAVMLRTPYKEGQWDCAIQVAEWAGIMDGANYRDGVRGKYFSKASGLRWLESLKPGIRTVAEALPLFLSSGWQCLRSEYGSVVEIGDLVELDDGSVGIWDGEGVLCIAPGRCGYSLVSVSHAVAAWKYSPINLS